MNSAQRTELKKRLVSLARELAHKGERTISPNRTDEAKVGGDEDEQPLNEMHQAIASSRNRNDSLLAVQVDRALSRLSEAPEDFGLCLECGDEIRLARLKAMPYAELCLECQSKRDGPRGGPTRRKVTDYV